MAITFFYKNTPYIQIETISIIGEFNDYDENATPLELVKSGWFVDIELPTGKYPYKFIINGVLRLNDPNASLYSSDRDGEIWSVVYVGINGELKPESDCGILHLTNHVISNKTMDLIEEVRHKNNFNIHMDSKVAAGFEFCNISGKHTITAIWVNSQYHMHHISDHYIDVNDGDENNAADVWFWIDLQEKEREYPLGTWYVKLFVDGGFLMEEKFTIGNGGTYQATNRGIFLNQGFDIRN